MTATEPSAVPAGVPHPFRVRKQSSGWTTSETFIVVQLRDGRAHRVTVNPYGTRQGAEANADDLNIAAGTAPFNEDPRPWEVRRAEAAERYFAAKAAGFPKGPTRPRS